ncbi:MAG TPA: hypothetical protein VGM20_02285 [Gemmatimonadales bacterium]
MATEGEPEGELDAEREECETAVDQRDDRADRDRESDGATQRPRERFGEVVGWSLRLA